MYVIPQIHWHERKTETITIIETTNTFVEYSIKLIDGVWYCFYGNGRHKLFNTLTDAMEWVEQIHYPAQVEKYLDKL